MKIAVWDNLPSGGGKRALYEHVKGLAGRGHGIESWCPETAQRDYLPLDEFGVQHVLPLDKSERGWHSRVWALCAWQNLRRTRRQLLALDRHCAACAEQINRSAADVVFVGGSQVMPVPAIGRYLATPSVFYLGEPLRELHEARPHLPWVGPGRNAGRRPVWTMAGDALELRRLQLLAGEEIANAEGLPCILVNSLFTRETVMRVYGRDSSVCYLGVDFERFVPSSDGVKEPYVVALGELTRAKGVDRALRAMAAIDLDPKPPLEWICNRVDPECVEFADAFCRSAGLRLRRHVAVPDPRVREVLQRAAVMIYTPRLEPFGFAPLEANACGTAAVGIAEGGLRETIVEGENGLLVEQDAPVLLARAVSRYVRDLSFAADAGRRAREHVTRRWSWNSAVTRLESVLQAACQRG
jgi:glycosyltransferase involved in cell wall biosynthesis